ncbi:DNA-directed RNA polymerase 3 subunit [Grosmannia clavigera kw1407]|uniref:DNA-directed RNA polymerase III subunit n=1 Tax=Grosmannia clavigera (strain kw1407 / UAMH 11150) TaxID=655863 RepID=F0XCB9_GROCL|nr:DNA-directed RNA polymerase 3 subunit [Grosmannia clavigera kw1407]EFX03989.1 DNA-directed RNA polymerase 3 subunit [Grosmannia clavigera kw1407]
MSRGGRGGGRGGRRGGGLGLPWGDDPSMKADSKPVELFPPFSVPTAAPLAPQERQVVDRFLLMREQIHSSPLYTQTRIRKDGDGDGDGSGKAYGQDQINRQYGIRTKATLDPFTAVPLYSHRFEKQDRVLPDLTGRPFSKELFPPELWPTLDGIDDGRRLVRGSHTRRSLGGAQAGRRTLALSEVTTLRTAEEIFQRRSAAGGDDDTRKALEQLEKFKNVGLDNEDNVEFELVEDEGDYDEVEDEAYDDDEEGDYNAEAAFDNGDDDDYGDDFGDGGGGDDGVY